MLKRLVHKFFAPSASAPASAGEADNVTPDAFSATPPIHIEAPGVKPLNLKALMREENGFPLPDWDAVMTWLKTIPGDDQQGVAWGQCELAWLQHLREALGEGFRLRVADQVALLSSKDDASARATMAFVSRARQRIVRTLEGVAE
ncbi:MAG: hypothetical protein C0453_12395, partial [Comamonadaceae bacterium]|nr:hypothetical protein [Comamonadaceae bacterium]